MCSSSLEKNERNWGMKDFFNFILIENDCSKNYGDSIMNVLLTLDFF